MTRQEPNDAGVQPGDRNIRAVVRPDLAPGLFPPGTWACTRCGDEFDKRSTHAVIYGPRDLTVPYAFMVCPDCAEELTPMRLSLNWQQLTTYNPSTGTGGEQAAPLIADHVTEVLNRRGQQPPPDVRLRAADTHLLADALATTRLQLVQRLVRMKVLSGLEVATSPTLTGPS